MIIDGHTHIGERDPVWGKAPFFGDDLIEMMDEPFTFLGEQRRIDMAVAMPRPGVTTLIERTFEEQHADVISAIEKYPDRLLGNFMFNPRLGMEAGISFLRKMVKAGTFRMLKLHPTLHNYWPQEKAITYPILEEAAELEIPVLVHTGEPPYSVPALLDRVARDHPRVNIIIGHFGTQFVTYAADAVNVARHNSNVFLETGWGVLPRLAEGVSVIGAERLIFGSDSPPQDPFSQLRVVECLGRKPPVGVGLSDDDIRKIAGGNLRSLLKLDGVPTRREG
jgi:predicted TIM-barrel fold metal-dependent hydrolase